MIIRSAQKSYSVVGSRMFLPKTRLETGPVLFEDSGKKAEQSGWFILEKDRKPARLQLDEWLGSPSDLKIPTALDRKAFYQKITTHEPIPTLMAGALQVDDDPGVFIPASIIDIYQKALGEPTEEGLFLVIGFRNVLHWPDPADRLIGGAMIDAVFEAAWLDAPRLPGAGECTFAAAAKLWNAYDSLNLESWMMELEERLEIKLSEDEILRIRQIDQKDFESSLDELVPILKAHLDSRGRLG